MITKQCNNCAKKGKNSYCKACDKTSELFNIYSYYTDKSSEHSWIGMIKAFTWHDVLEHIKDNFFCDLSTELYVNCKNDFAYIEKKSYRNTDSSASERSIGYKIYLNKGTRKTKAGPKGDFWDLTLT